MDANMKRSSRSDISVRGANHKEAKTKQKPDDDDDNDDDTKAETLFLYLHPTAAAVVLLAGGGVSRSHDAPLLGRLVPLTRLTGVKGHSPLTFAVGGSQM